MMKQAKIIIPTCKTVLQVATQNSPPCSDLELGRPLYSQQPIALDCSCIPLLYTSPSTVGGTGIQGSTEELLHRTGAKIELKALPVLLARE